MDKQIHDNERDATATIRGYVYQFDATILALLALGDGDSLIVENLEDYDVESGDFSKLYQCKYYEATRLTPSTIRDAILPMLTSFLRLTKQDRMRRYCYLYGFFKDSAPTQKTLTVQELKKSLVRKEHIKSKGKPTKLITIDLQKQLGASDQDLNEFVQQLKIHVTEDFDTHRGNVFSALRKHSGTTSYETEHFLYPSARTLISSIAAKTDRASRVLTKAQFLSKVTPSRALFNTWALREHGEREYCARLRRDYFSENNIENAVRVFVIDSSAVGTDSDILSVCHTIRMKWSSHRIQRKPDSERFAPFVYFRGLSQARQIALKSALQSDGATFVDGYPFLGATFSVEQLCTQQTFTNKLSLRVITSEVDLVKLLQFASGRRFLYDFFKDSPTNVTAGFRVISIPISKIAMVEKII